MKWREATLGELTELDGGLIQTGPFGSQLHQSDYQPEGIPVIMPKDIANGRVLEESVARIAEETANRLERHKVKQRSIVLPRRGEVTKRAYIRAEQEGWICGTGCLKIEANGKKLVPEYLYYFMEQDHVVQWLEQHAVGTTMLNLSAGIVADLPIRYPSVEVQNEIATTLTTYDDLIENNRRRMVLLEEAARQLYQEWFVRLKFPGHEHTRIIDGVPEGWEKKCIYDFGNVITGKTPSTKESDNYDGEISFIKTPDMHGNVYVTKTESRLTEKGAETQRGKYIPPNSLLVSCIGTIGVVALSSESSQFNQQINTVIPSEDYFRCYCFFAFKDLKQKMEAIGGGATMGNVNKSKFESLKVMRPNTRLLREFEATCAPMFRQILTLSYQNDKLKVARNLLLPRLMNGEINV